ncbi:Cyanovirin-N [Ilyonectria robusta]|uniref:Cyanovirin-N n=1 Tax=Ilyonectria robusta TaxID=1079257 RepID=UPI001E8D2FF2|nr:Cyanovirin-N [Ilyonectria robusta]KAH8714554.1 Cyanovirin-N [Ilyonectria robusta]
MQFIFLSILTAALGVCANPSTPNDGAPNHSPDTDLGVNITNIELEERGNSGTWGGFADSCTDIRYYLSNKDMKKYEIGESNPNSAVGVKPYLDSPVIVARCPNLSGQTRCSVLRIGDCMANREGKLQIVDKGKWHTTCTQCAFQSDGRYFACQCYTGKGKNLQTTVVNLNELINNFDGNLMCFSNRGSPEYCPHGPSFDITKYGSNGYWYTPWGKPGKRRIEREDGEER